MDKKEAKTNSHPKCPRDLLRMIRTSPKTTTRRIGGDA